MDSCCENKVGELALLRDRQSKVLYSVLAINVVGFLVEFTAGWLASSTALLGDSLDMFGDASVYVLTLFVLEKGRRARAGAGLFKGVFMLLFGVVVVIDAVRKLVLQEVPDANWMGAIGLFALVANGICFAFLYRHRSDDFNMRSTWLCSRNDLFANSSVIAAAGLVALTNTLWPDIIVGLAIAGLFLHSAWQVIREGLNEWRLGSAERTSGLDTDQSGGNAPQSCCATGSKNCASESNDSA